MESGSTRTTASNGSARAKTKEMAVNTESEESENESGEESKSEPDSENESASDSGTDYVESCSEESGSGSDKQETTDKEGGRIPYHQTDSVSEPVGGETEYDEDYKREQNDRAAEDIERMLEQMAEKATCTQLENERIKELNDAAKSISYGNIHNGVNIAVHRIADVDEQLQDQYHAISGPLLNISRQLQRSLIQKLKDQQRGGKQTGLVMGRRLDAHALCRNDGKVFYKNNLPNEIPRISVGLLLDESGSMSCGDRATYARAAAIILYDFCQSLNIPIMVYGHSTGWRTGVDLYSYAEFDSIDKNDKYRLMDISARGRNRDGAALRYVAEQLSKREEEVRILILVSDGQPADSGYSGTAAEEDLRGIKQEYKRKGLLFVAAAIGDDTQNIERIYGDSFLDITDLNQLPVKLTTVIKRFMQF
jgi:cobalamin biosynthesis protein CobT